MKTQRKNQKRNGKAGVVVLAFLGLLMLQTSAYSQKEDQVQTLFRQNSEITSVLAPEFKINSIQGTVGTLVGLYGGAMIDRKFLLGLSGGVNLSHPHVNYGYIGGIAQYVFNPSRLVHFSSQLVLAYGSTKDYESEKSGLFDNFWNISGTHFFMAEPGINLEINLKQNLTLCTGVSYRFVSGLDENSQAVSVTHVTSREMSGININVGLKFGKKKKN